MKKWMAGLAAVAIILIAYAVHIYKNTMDKKIPGGEDAVAAAVEEAALAEVASVDYYHGKSAYAVIRGKDESGEQWIVFVPDKKGRVLMYSASEGISEQEALQKVTEEEQPKQIISAKLGAEDETPVWVVTYIDQENRYAYYYMRFQDGKRDVQYSISQ